MCLKSPLPVIQVGVLPLAFASGPGSGAKNASSIGVRGGITTTTIFVIFFGPYFFIWVYRLFKHDVVLEYRKLNDAREKTMIVTFLQSTIFKFVKLSHCNL